MPDNDNDDDSDLKKAVQKYPAASGGPSDDHFQKFREAYGNINTDDDEDDGDGDDDYEGANLHKCLECGWTDDIDTPKMKTEHYCEGDCDDFRRFKRADKVNDDE